MTKNMYVMGVDVGSSTSKCVILSGGEIAGSAVIPVGAGTSGPGRAITEALLAAGIGREDVSAAAATGYGRNFVTEAGRTFSEMSCHARGAAWLFPGVRTVIDIGGQDAKALAVSPEGKLVSFVMNDKCAAGTGRFLEVMARILETEPSGLAELDAKAESCVEISSTCTVFAESEVISRLAQGVPICDIVAGIHRSVAVRAASLVMRLGITEPVYMTGGVAQNGGVLRALQRELGVPVKTDGRTQLAGALGAALLLCDKLSEGEMK